MTERLHPCEHPQPCTCYEEGYRNGIEAGLMQYMRVRMSPHAPDCSCKVCDLERQVRRSREHRDLG